CFPPSLYRACSEHTKAYKCFAENLQTVHRKQVFSEGIWKMSKPVSEDIRILIQDCFTKRLFDAAVFFCHKLTSCSQFENLEDIFLLAQSYFHTQQFKRAIQMLVSNGLASRSIEKTQETPTDKQLTQSLRLRSSYLAADCAGLLDNWEDCLQLLGGENIEHIESTGPEIKISSAICCLRGRAFLNLENRNRASHWIKESLIIDPKNCEAFNELVDHHLLSNKEAKRLIEELNIDSENEWIRMYYQSKVSQFDSKETSVISKLQTILPGDIDVLTNAAETHYNHNEFRSALSITQRFIQEDPFIPGNLLLIHLACLLELKKKNELYYLSQKLKDEQPTWPVSSYAVGCYYTLTKDVALARAHFKKCTSTNGQFGYGWIGLGHAYSMHPAEHDQAISVYRNASRVMPDSHIPFLSIGMELIKMESLTSAVQNINTAASLCGSDPLIHNELGVTLYKNGQFQEAAQCFRTVLSMVEERSSEIHESEIWETTVFNLAHCYRREKKYAEAIELYKKCLSATPEGSSVMCMLGFTHQLMDRLHEAIEYYHSALSVRPDYPFAVSMLNTCLENIRLATLALLLHSLYAADVSSTWRMQKPEYSTVCVKNSRKCQRKHPGKSAHWAFCWVNLQASRHDVFVAALKLNRTISEVLGKAVYCTLYPLISRTDMDGIAFVIRYLYPLAVNIW
ncbi:hypothetical protein PROFUN_04584, partial [Planoprotostelium fungivorum]